MWNKKAVSEMVSYVLLVVIAIGLSVAVYGYLRVYVPKEKPACSEDIFLTIKDANCIRNGDNVELNLVLSNKGLFKINAAYIRFAHESRKVRELINPGAASKGDDANFYFNPADKEAGLNPGEDWPSAGLKEFIIESPVQAVANPNNYIIEIQPAVLSEEFGIVACTNSIITQKVVCI